MYKRAVAIFALLLVLLCGITARLWQLGGQGLEEVANQQATATVIAGRVRGTIYDRHLHPMVNTGEETRVCIPVTPQTTAFLSETLPSDVFTQLSERLRGGRPFVMPWDDTLPHRGDMPRFSVPTRYGTTLLAPHVIGYLNGDGVTGAAGIEVLFNDLLQSYEGQATATWQVNALGTPLGGIPPTLTNTLNKAKGGIALTLDADIQRLVERIAPTYLKKGAVVVMNSTSGDILAMASFPAFQPDTVAELLNSTDAPLLNRATGNYDVGSVFKIVSAAAAIEADVPLTQCYTCTGSVTLDGVVFQCNNRLGHGEQDMTQAFAASCNSYFIQLMQQVGAQPLYDMAVSLGFDRAVLLADGMKTARAELPTLDGLKVRTTLANLSFGQGALMATPVHLAQLVSVVVNGGMLQRANIIYGTVDEAESVTRPAATAAQYAMRPETASLLQEMMIAAVQDGATGAPARPLLDGAGGKTGTAETGQMGTAGKIEQSWFAGFYPQESPQYVIVVLAEDRVGTEGRAAPVFKDICTGLRIQNAD